MRVKDFYVYVVCRVDIEYFKNINQDLAKHGYKHVRAIVPTIEILKHVKNGKHVYDKIPLLFNYGFIKMSSTLAHDRVKLDQMRNKIPGIHSWVKNPTPLHRKRIMTRTDNRLEFDDFSIVAMVKREEVKRLEALSKQRYSHSNIMSINTGDMVTLKCYPYEGMDATILELNPNTHTARVQIFPGNVSLMILDVPLDTVLYSVYNNFNDDITTKEIESSMSQIPDESIEEL